MKNAVTALLIATAFSASNLFAAEYTLGDLTITDPYTRTTPPSAPVAGGFMTITNKGDKADTLLGGEVGFAEVVEVHEMPMIDGVMRMRQLENGLEIPPGESVELKPGSYHIMFIKLSEQMKEGDKHAATLRFAQAGEVEVELEVKDISKMMEHEGHGDMKKGHNMEHGKHTDMPKTEEAKAQ